MNIAIIPARGGSKRIPLKNIKEFCGKPMITYAINAANESGIFEHVVVSTDDEKITNHSKKLKVEVISRPKKLATDKAHIESVIEHSLNYLQKNHDYIPDLIVLLQNTSPLRTSKHVDAALKFFSKNKYDSILSAYPSHKFLWEKQRNNFKSINYDPLKRPNRQDMNDQYIENGAIYITKYTSFKKTKCRISGKIGIFKMSEDDSIDIDTTFDLLHAQLILKSKKK